MSSFKDNVLFYLGTMINEDTEEEIFDLFEGEETDDNAETCPKCGKKKCECKKVKDDEDEDSSRSTETAGGDDDDDGYSNEDDEDDDEDKKLKKDKKASRSTETAGGDDDDDGYSYNASTETEKKTLGDIKDPREMLDYFKKRGSSKLVGELTPEEVEFLKAFVKSKKSSIAIKDDHTSGRNGSIETSIKESISDFAYDKSSKAEEKKYAEVVSIIKEMIKSKRISKAFRKNKDYKAANAFSLAEEAYLNKEPNSLKKFKDALNEFVF